MQSDLRALLAGDATLTGLVGTGIYWNAIPQGAPDPCLRLTLVSGGPGITMTGSDGLSGSLVQIDVRALKVSDMITVRDTLVPLLHGYSGTQGATDFRGIFLRSERQTSEKTDTALYHRASLDFDVYSRAAA